MSEKIQKHKMIMVVYDDDTIDFQFEGYENWAAGRMQRQVEKGARILKQLQGQLRHKIKLAEHNALKAENEKAEKDKAIFAVEFDTAKNRSEYLVLKIQNKESSLNDVTELKGLKKAFPTLNIDEEVLDNGNDRQGNRDNTKQSSGRSAEDSSGTAKTAGSVPENNTGNDERDAGRDAEVNDGASDGVKGKYSGIKVPEKFK